MNKIAILIAAGLLAGCGANDSADSGYKEEDRNGQALTTRDDGKVGGDHDINADNGMDRTMSDQNPNFPDISRNRHNFSSDVSKARQAVDSVDGFTADEIWIDGDTMNVSVRHGKNLSAKEKAKQQAKIKEKLVNALPRYEINVEMEHEK
ncbi:hypothetical protein [Mesobacillus zeae]|uniref:Sporulation protein n=1 Tax=Mesobacillus zeae TaxID=1917180 RepID=A0A398BA57_9BACI|nr:hypothetical protein [Mesobacillus zeae]RID86885.1 hypothetical protein D1970_06460 [Mesobacillus zeae]